MLPELNNQIHGMSASQDEVAAFSVVFPSAEVAKTE